MQNSPATGEKTRVSLHSVVETAFRQKKVFFNAFLAALALAMILIFVPHRKYESDMSLLVQNSRGNEVLTAGPTTGMPVVSDVTDEQITSVAGVLTSMDVLDEVVSPGWSKTPPQNRSEDELTEHAKDVNYLLKHLDVTPTKKSHLIDVTLKARDPKLATSQMSHLLTVFLAKQRDLQRPAGATSFFASEADRYSKLWEDAQAKLSAFEQERSLTNPQAKETLLYTELADANLQLRTTDAEIGEFTKRVQADQQAVNTIPQRLDTLQRKLPDEGYVDTLNNTLVQLTNQRTELLTKYQPTDRLVQQVDSQIAGIKESLADSTKNNFQEATTNVNPTWAAADASLTEKRSALAAAQGRRRALLAEVDKIQGELNSTEGSELGFGSLQHAVSDAEANYNLYTQKRDASQIADAMDEHSLLNVSVVQSPTYSIDPAFPKPLLDICLAIFSAIFIACFAVFFAESGRQTFATPHELELASPYPVLATVPMESGFLTDATPALPPSTRVSILTAVSSRASRLSRTSILRLW